MNHSRGFVQLSFSKIAFPYKEISIDGEMRDNVHEYPHTAGGSPEKQGRRLYLFDIQTDFIADSMLPQYRDLWPSNLGKLVQVFEEGRTEDLVLPQLGIPTRAYCTNWTRSLKSSFTNGESVRLKFREDSEKLRLAESFVTINSRNFDTAFAVLKNDAKDKGVGLLDKILRLGSDILAVKDQIELGVQNLDAKLQSLISMCKQFINVADFAKDVKNWKTLDAVHGLLAQAIALYQDQQQKGIQTKVFTVPSDMSLSQLSQRIFGVSNKGQDILAMNRVPDPFAIKQGARIRYYPDE